MTAQKRLKRRHKMMIKAFKANDLYLRGVTGKGIDYDMAIRILKHREACKCATIALGNMLDRIARKQAHPDWCQRAIFGIG